MLVLGRDTDQQVIITHKASGAAVKVTVTCKRDPRGFVRLGFEAPSDFRIDRAEVSASRKQEGLPC